MNLRLLIALLAPAVSLSGAAFADSKASCVDAASKGQKFKGVHKLIEARDQLRVCAAAECPAVIQTDCAAWLTEVERALPTVVVVAQIRGGGDLFDVKVTVDGHLLVSRIDGRAVPLNAGPHTFAFELPDGTALNEQVLVREGEQNQRVAALFDGPASPPAPGEKAVAAAGPRSEVEGPSNPWKTVGWVTGGVGVVGVAVGAVFGAIALGDKGRAHCDGNNVCDSGTTGAIKTAALASDIGWIAGGALLATGAGLVLFSKDRSAPGASGVRVAPVMTATGGGIVAGGAW